MMPSQKSGPPANRSEPDLSAMSTLPLLVSPPGMDAPLDLANYTPDFGMMHPAGTISPRGSLQITPIGPKYLKSLKAALDGYGKNAPSAGESAKAKEKPKAPKAPKPPVPPKLQPPDLSARTPAAPKLRPPTVS